LDLTPVYVTRVLSSFQSQNFDSIFRPKSQWATRFHGFASKGTIGGRKLSKKLESSEKLARFSSKDFFVATFGISFLDSRFLEFF
jgi:hypothetical protein